MTFDFAWPALKDHPAAVAALQTDIIPAYSNTCRWFAGKARPQDRFELRIVQTMPTATTLVYFGILTVYYHDGAEENYFLPLAFVTDQQDINPKGIIAEVDFGGQVGMLIDAIYDFDFQQEFYRRMAQHETLDAGNGTVDFYRGKGMDEADRLGGVSSRNLGVDSSNSAMIFGEKYFFKLYRKLFHQTNPEVEMVEFITENSNFSQIPAFCGGIVWQRNQQPDVTLGMMQRMVSAEKDNWAQTGDYLNDFMFGFVDGNFQIKETVFDQVRLLAQRTAQMHQALYAPHATDAAFAPQLFDDDYRRFLHKRFSELLERRYNLLIDSYLTLDETAKPLAWKFMEAKEMLDGFADEILTRPFDSLRVRIHGDYHLGQVLSVQNDFVLIDFEGEPEATITDRKIKHSPLKDVAGMIRSYHYAVCSKLFNSTETATANPAVLQRATDRWYKIMKETFFEEYMETFGWPHPLFKNQSEINYLLLFYLLEKAVYELGYELSYRPSWVKIPLKGIVDVIKEVEKL